MKKVDISQIPEFGWLESKIGEWAAWYNEKRPHSGQGMDDKTPMQVFAENAEPRRELPENLKKYVFTLRWTRTVQRDGVNLDGTWYYTKELQQLIGQRVEVRRGLDNTGKVHIFSMPDRRYLFDADDLTWSGVVEEDIRRINKLQKEARALQKKYNKKKAEYDAGPFKTPSELHALETMRQTELKVVNGESLSADASNLVPRLTLVKTDEPTDPKRKIRLPTDPD